jgi:rhomboid protease GluP
MFMLRTAQRFHIRVPLVCIKINILQYMKDISIKLRHIYLRYILISIGFIVLYSSIRWYLDYELGVLHLKEDLLNFWIPFALPLVPIAIWLRRGIMCLNIRGKNDNGFFAFQFIAAITIFLPTLITQEYIEASSSKLIKVQSVSEIKKAKNTDCYVIRDFNIIKDYSGAYQASRTSGRNNEDLRFTNYFVVPLVNSSNQVHSYSHKYWYGIRFTEEMSNYASNDRKTEQWKSFYQKCIRDYKRYDFENFVYLQGVSYSDDRDGYIEAIKARQNNVNTEDLIILEPIDKPFEEKLGNKFGWIFGSFGIGAFVFLLMILIPSVNKTELKRYLDKKPLKEDDLKDMLKFLVPKGDHFTAAILIDINLIIFILLVTSGISIMSATPKELLELGANRRYEVMNGEYWRLFSSMFLHGGLMHIFMNLFGIGATCSLIEPILGRYKTLIAYLISGIGASLMSIYWHENTVSVGASGAIFGMMGVMIALLVTKKDNDFKSIYYVILGLYGGVSLLFGLLGGIDNAAHIGGLLTGFIIGLILIIIDWQKLTQASKM